METLLISDVQHALNTKGKTTAILTLSIPIKLLWYNVTELLVQEKDMDDIEVFEDKDDGLFRVKVDPEKFKLSIGKGDNFWLVRK